jgi:hypothetical protein
MRTPMSAWLFIARRVDWWSRCKRLTFGKFSEVFSITSTISSGCGAPLFGSRARFH